MNQDIVERLLAKDAAAIIRSLMRELGICDHIHARENSYVSTERVLNELDEFAAEASTEITTLRDRVAKLEAALRGLLRGLGPDGYVLPAGAQATARARQALHDQGGSDDQPS